MNEKRLLKAVFVKNLVGDDSGAASLARFLDADEMEVKSELDSLGAKKLVQYTPSASVLTPRGRKKLRVVFIGGTFEIIHAGHLYTIEQAKRLGDVLVVVVARDNTVRKRKGREPVSREQERVRVVGSIRFVDLAILGSEKNIYDTLERVRPDVVALGYDQYHTEGDIVAEAKRRGMEISVVRLDSPFPTLKASKILERLSL